MNGKAMFYPNLPEQASFSTHHREHGEHTDVVSRIPILDDLTLKKNPLFTVPLVLNSTALELFSNPFSLKTLPVVNFYHEKVKNLYALRQVGLYLLETFASNYKSKQKETLPACILDYLSPYDEYQKRQWDLLTTFEPIGGILEQIEQLKVMFKIGEALNRKIILPKAKLPSGKEISFNSIIKVTQPYAKSSSSNRGRSILVQKIDETGIVQNSNWKKDFFPLSSLTDREIVQWFGSCRHDRILKIDRPDLLFSQTLKLRPTIDNGANLAEYQGWIKEIAHEIGTKLWTGNYICIDVTRPSKKVCKKLSVRFGWENPFHQANCVISPLSSLSNGTVFSDKEGESKPFLYAIANSEDWENVALSNGGDGKVERITLPLIRRTFLSERINFQGTLQDSTELARLVEVELCTGAKEFIGSLYSISSIEILKRRDIIGKKSRVIGR